MHVELNIFTCKADMRKLNTSDWSVVRKRKPNTTETESGNVVADSSVSNASDSCLLSGVISYHFISYLSFFSRSWRMTHQ